MTQEVASLSVAISTRDRPRALSRCLDSLLEGDERPAEIVVVDQSQDGETEAVVESHRRLGAVITYVSHAGSGLAVSQNIAIARARHAVVAVTDDDCVVDPRWLALTAHVFAASDSVDLLTGRVLPLGPDAPGLHPVSSRTSTLRRTFGPDAMPWDVGSGNNFVIRREWFVRVGGNDERLGPGSPGQGGVDMDLFYRLVRAGARVRYEPECVVYHERATRAARLARRRPYGFGMGACCSLRYAEGDTHARSMAARWLLLRLRFVAGALRGRDWQRAHEEVLILAGTLQGLSYGYRCRRGASVVARRGA